MSVKLLHWFFFAKQERVSKVIIKSSNYDLINFFFFLNNSVDVTRSLQFDS